MTTFCENLFEWGIGIINFGVFPTAMNFNVYWVKTWLDWINFILKRHGFLWIIWLLCKELDFLWFLVDEFSFFLSFYFLISFTLYIHQYIRFFLLNFQLIKAHFFINGYKKHQRVSENESGDLINNFFIEFVFINPYNRINDFLYDA